MLTVVKAPARYGAALFASIKAWVVLVSVLFVPVGLTPVQGIEGPSVNNGLEAILSCAELDSLQKGGSGSFASAPGCAVWIDTARQKYCPADIGREEILRMFLAQAPGIRGIAHLLKPDDLIRSVLRPILKCRQSDEIRNAEWPPLPPDAGAVASAALQRSDFETALVILRPLARSGDRIAQHDLGVLYATGRGVGQDFRTAENFFRMAANNRYAPSFHSLGLMFARGEGVRVDLVESYKWLELARGELRSTSEAGLLPKVLEMQRKLSERLTSEQVNTATKRAEAWSPGVSMAINTRLAEIQTVEEFNTRCQAYDNIHEEIRRLDDLIRAERVNGKYDLVTCLAVIEYSQMLKQCDGRDPVLGELLFYLRFLGSPELRAVSGGQLPSSAAVSTALVIGSYCKPIQPQPGSEATFAKLRAAYRDKVRAP